MLEVMLRVVLNTFWVRNENRTGWWRLPHLMKVVEEWLRRRLYNFQPGIRSGH